MVAALGWEAAAIRRGLGSLRADRTEGDLRLWRGTPGGVELWLLATGMGAERAARALERVLPRIRPGVVLSTGCAGALRPGLEAGDLLGARDVVAPRGERFPSDPGWLERYRTAAARAGVRFERGSLLTAEGILASPERKRAARERTGCDAVDLETAAIAAEAGRHGVPFAAARVILDSEAASLPVEIVDSRGRPRAAAIAAAVLRSPQLLGRLAGLARAAARCRRALEAVHAEMRRSLTET